MSETSMLTPYKRLSKSVTVDKVLKWKLKYYYVNISATAGIV